MCGILGVFNVNPKEFNLETFNNALTKINHRGPDNLGFEIFDTSCGKLALGHARLAIIDLSINGNQPMHSFDKRYVLIYNGEIYNYEELKENLISKGYKFETETDTEVLIASWIEWGVECIKKLNGMFSFAIYDSELEEIILVRDAFGIKPLYFSITNNSLIFGSEISVLECFSEVDNELNISSAYNYLSFGQYDNTSNTFLKNINHLLPGHFIKISLKAIKDKIDCHEIIRWWYPSIKERSDLSFDEAALQLRELFLKNVKMHLRSDVPIGAALSGGLDSSAIVCAIRYLEPDLPIHTFSYVARDTNFDEEKWIDKINFHVKAIGHKVVIKPEEFINDLDEMILTQGEPFYSTSIYAQYRVFKAAKEAGIIVTLDGQGADELLAGYNGYPQGLLHSMFEKGEYFKIIYFLYFWSKWPGRKFKDSYILLSNLLVSKKIRFLIKKIMGLKSNRPKLINQDLLNSFSDEINSDFSASKLNDGYKRRLVQQLRDALTGNGLASLLRHGDRNSMRWSIESRVPFLTTEMAEFILSLPESYLLSTKGETKSIFRYAMRGIVPDEILDRRDKLGFQTPEKDWLLSNKLYLKNWLLCVKDIKFLNNLECKNEILKIFEKKGNFKQQNWWVINYYKWANLLIRNKV